MSDLDRCSQTRTSFFLQYLLLQSTKCRMFPGYNVLHVAKNSDGAKQASLGKQFHHKKTRIWGHHQAYPAAHPHTPPTKPYDSERKEKKTVAKQDLHYWSKCRDTERLWSYLEKVPLRLPFVTDAKEARELVLNTCQKNKQHNMVRNSHMGWGTLRRRWFGYSHVLLLHF